MKAHSVHFHFSRWNEQSVCCEQRVCLFFFRPSATIGNYTLALQFDGPLPISKVVNPVVVCLKRPIPWGFTHLQGQAFLSIWITVYLKWCWATFYHLCSYIELFCLYPPGQPEPPTPLHPFLIWNLITCGVNMFEPDLPILKYKPIDKYFFICKVQQYRKGFKETAITEVFPTFKMCEL